jgi:LysR family hydrogen peroxide-inducible transcriptional activator
MNIRDLKYLVAVAEHGHFGKAAEACFVSQPALSMQIKKLESTLGVTLFERSNNSFLITPEGSVIVDYARQILNQIGDMLEAAQMIKDPYAGEIRLGVFPTLAPFLLPLIIPKITEFFPKLLIYLIEEKTEVLIEQLEHGKLDAAFLAGPLKEAGFDETPLFEEEFLLAISKKHPLKKNKIILESDLNHQELLLLEEGHCLRGQALAVCHGTGARENQYFRATSLETLRQMIISGIGITLMPKLACRPDPNLRYIPFNEPKPKRSIALYSRASSSRKLAIEAIAAVVKSLMQEILI